MSKFVKIKNILILLLLFLFLAQNNCVFSQEIEEQDAPTYNVENNKYIFHGKVEINEGQEKKNLFTGATKKITKGTNLKMTVSSVISSGYAQEGDEFFAEVTSDLAIQNGVVIPTGTTAHGKITKIQGSKRLGRDAYVNLSFDYLLTPDGRKIPVEASMTTKRHPVASVAKVALEDTAYTVAGGLIGGLLALKYLGLGAAVASHGYTLAGGAGVGGVIGATASLARKGGEALIVPGDEIRVQIKDAMELPVMTEEALKDEELILEGLDVKITGYKLEKDPFGELNTITLTLDIANKSDKTFSSFDMALVNDYKSAFYPSPFGNTELWFSKIPPNAHQSGKLSFAVDNPRKKFWLVFYDSSSRKPLAKFSVQNAERQLIKDKTAKKSG